MFRNGCDCLNDIKKELSMFLPCKIISTLNRVLNIDDWDNLIEIRIFRDGMILLEFYCGRFYITSDYKLCNKGEPILIDGNILDDLLKILTNCSQYAYVENINSGYFTVYGGHRIGIVGSSVLSNDGNIIIKSVNAVNIRISKDISRKFPFENAYEWGTTAVISPPKCGKTTFLRMIAKNISDNQSLVSICIVDERREVCSCHNGKSFYNLGNNISVVEGINKRQALRLLVRNMAPDIIICDEVTEADEVDAIRETILSGVNVIFSLHGKDMNAIHNRRIFKPVLEFIDTFVVLSNRKGPGTVDTIERKCI